MCFSFFLFFNIKKSMRNLLMKVKNNKNKVNFCDIILYKRYYFNYDKYIDGIYCPDENNDDELKY